VQTHQKSATVKKNQTPKFTIIINNNNLDIGLTIAY